MWFDADGRAGAPGAERFVGHKRLGGLRPARVRLPLPVMARFWPWLEPFSVRASLKPFRVLPPRSTAALLALSRRSAPTRPFQLPLFVLELAGIRRLAVQIMRLENDALLPL
jgi:hypothetical protein